MSAKTEFSEKQNQIFRKADRFADLSGYTRRQRVLVRFASPVLSAVIRTIGATVRFETRDWHFLEDIERAGETPIYAFWHNQIFLAAYYFRGSGAVVLVSQSFDGEYIARAIQRLGFGVARGSSTRGGVGALVEMARLVRLKRTAAFTIDGPKGPRYVAKTGALLLAKKTRQPVVPISFTASKFREINSWDKLRIPRVRTRALVALAAPVRVSATANDAEISARRDELQTALENLQTAGEDWRREIVK